MSTKEVQAINYTLPKERIAQWPVGQTAARSCAMLLVASSPDNGGVSIENRIYANLPDILRPGDLLVLNDSKVIPSRFFCSRNGGDREFEVVLLEEESRGDDYEIWRALARPMRHLKPGDRLELSDNLCAEVLGRAEDPSLIRISVGFSENARPPKTIEKFRLADGLMPIPPYIRDGRAEADDRHLYQTIYAKNFGSIAAPTAGLHFTEQLLGALAENGVEIGRLTLHVGRASIRPVQETDLNSDTLPKERYQVSDELRQQIRRAKKENRRVVAVGTTTVRALESMALGGDVGNSSFQNGLLESDLFIKPGFEFCLVDALITNFHMPGSSHLLLVAAFIGEEATRQIYEHALAADYRFLSYGDGMLLEPSRSGEAI